MEIGEIIAAPELHGASNEKCPFCPKEPEKPTYTTHPGSANNPKLLGQIMESPSLLTSKQENARPKEGDKDQQSCSEARRKPTPIYEEAMDLMNPRRHHGPYSCEAHHLISGKQALAGRDFEQWIVAGKVIERHTGYSINNSDNGFWAPSIPERYKNGVWGTLTFEQKLAVARKPMEAGEGQFHKSHHAISDPDDPDCLKHGSYDDYIKKRLDEMNERMWGWTKTGCPLCQKAEREKKRFQPSVRVNQALDNLSTHMHEKITGSPKNWTVFLSSYAIAVHRPVCLHAAQRKSKE